LEQDILPAPFGWINSITQKNGECSMLQVIKFEVPVHKLSGVIKACPKKDPREILMGVCFELTSGNCKLTATDGVKLTETSFSINVSGQIGDEIVKFVAPVETLKDAFRYVGNGKYLAFEISFDADTVQNIKIQDVFNCSPVSGKIPDYSMFFPPQVGDEVVISFNVKELKAVLDSIYAIEKNNSISFKISPSFPERPLQISIPGDDERVSMGLLMPLRR
jgi:DNA polymerase III sliding clamp (beta) subunit (PCNA family)